MNRSRAGNCSATRARSGLRTEIRAERRHDEAECRSGVGVWRPRIGAPAWTPLSVRLFAGIYVRFRPKLDSAFCVARPRQSYRAPWLWPGLPRPAHAQLSEDSHQSPRRHADRGGNAAATLPLRRARGLLFLDQGAATDNHREGKGGPRLRSTFINAPQRLKLLTGRDDPRGRDEQYERFYLLLVEASPDQASVRADAVGDPATVIPLERVIADLLELVAERNSDVDEYDEEAGRLVRA